MSGRLAELGAVTALAVIVTVLLGAPVLRAPSERVFGAETVGRHHDPFTVMQRFERPLARGEYAQPLTDLTGALIARALGAVAAYNWLVLISFPLAAAASYLLARHLALSPAGATVVAMAYAFSPFHLAQAAYHPHIAQTQWIPLYLLALWRCLDAATPGAVAALGAATVAVTLSNFYGGFIAAAITPVAVAAYWVGTRRAGTQPLRRLGVTAGTLLLVAAAGLAYAWFATSAVEMDPAAFAFSRADLFRYSAKWWSYLVPPVSNPLLGATARRVWDGAGVHQGLLEQQVSLGWGIVALGLIAIFRWLVRVRPPAPLAHVPVLVIVASAALLCSLSPERTIGTFTFVRPSALLYDVMPWFRSYARFGVVVQLMAALLAGIGVDWLLRSATWRARIAAAALLALVAAEYAVPPSALWRDVLPTTAHRWVMQQPEAMRILDCAPRTPDAASIPWLTSDRILLLSEAIADCAEPNLAKKLAANGYTHVLFRRDGQRTPAIARPAEGDGLRVTASFDDGRVFAVVARPPALYTGTITGFSPREHDVEWSWRWMGAEAAWVIENTTPRPIVATLHLEAAAFHYDRRVSLLVDGRPVQTLVVAPGRRSYVTAPFTFPRGAHELKFRPDEPPTVADEVIHNRDRRPLSIAIGTWTWAVEGEDP
ncbi:MAG: hypothetical protein WC815_00590 [Vicinamibacterales bacterium]